MSNNNRNFVIAYIFLVILPVIALAGILRAGHIVKAPPSVDGIWVLRMDRGQLASLPCGKTLAAIEQNSIVISQSGETFELSFANGPRVSGAGVVDGAALRASLIPGADWSAEFGCGGKRRLSLVATLAAGTKQKSLAGKLSVDDCPSCTPVDFYALRQAAPASKEGH
jgi:hypothetical protein